MNLVDEIRQRVIEKGSTAQVGSNYQLLAKEFAEIGYSVNVRTKGVITTDMQFKKNGEEPFSAILNKNSILFYFRKPAFRNLYIDIKKANARFGDANENNGGELTLRIENPSQVHELVDWIRQY